MACISEVVTSMPVSHAYVFGFAFSKPQMYHKRTQPLSALQLTDTCSDSWCKITLGEVEAFVTPMTRNGSFPGQMCWLPILWSMTYNICSITAMTVIPTIAPKIKLVSSVIFSWIMGLFIQQKDFPYSAPYLANLPLIGGTWRVFHTMSVSLAHLDFCLKIVVYNSRVFQLPLSSRFKSEMWHVFTHWKTVVLYSYAFFAYLKPQKKLRQEPLNFFLPVEYIPTSVPISCFWR